MLELQHLCAGYGSRTVLHDVSVSLRPGTLLCLVGPNGCGKSTLLRATLRMLPVSEGRVILDGTDVYDYVAEKRGSITSYVITYPNGATYHWTATEHGGAGGWSDDYDETTYISGNILVFAIEECIEFARTQKTACRSIEHSGFICR